MSAILFGLFHYNLQNLAGPIILGIVFGYLVTITDSIWAGVVAHATNNGVAVLMGFFLQSFTPQKVEQTVEETQAAMATLKFPNVIPGMIVFLLIAIGCLFVAAKFIQVIQKDYAELEENKDVIIGRTKYKILRLVDNEISILAESYFNMDDYSSKIKHMTLARFKRYSFRLVESPKKLTIDYTDVALKMIPIIISLIIYIFLWMRYLLYM